MKIAPQERVKVRGECMRLLRTLKLDPAKSQLIWGFVEAYLRLTAEETVQFERQAEKMTPEEQEETMELLTSWGRQGKEEGLQQGKEELVGRLLRRRLGPVPANLLDRLDQLSPAQLDDLGEALLDFAELADLERWLSQFDNPRSLRL